MRPTFSSIYTDFAKALSHRSTCTRMRVGCVIASENSKYVYGIGYNGGAAGMQDCCTGEEGKCGCLHAEINAIINCNNHNPEQPKVIYTTLSPCVMCAKAIINLSGVTKVVYLEGYRNREGIELLEKAGIKCLNFSTPAA